MNSPTNQSRLKQEHKHQHSSRPRNFKTLSEVQKIAHKISTVAVNGKIKDNRKRVRKGIKNRLKTEVKPTPEASCRLLLNVSQKMDNTPKSTGIVIGL
jgi:hypothetical protein